MVRQHDVVSQHVQQSLRLTSCADCPACTTIVVVRLDVNTGAISTHGLLWKDTLAPAKFADLACTHDQSEQHACVDRWTLQ
jgi:hypothetical protein